MLRDNGFKYAIALTGGIATGKSTVSNILMLHGFLTIDADKIAHKLLDENRREIAKLFGYEYIDNNKVNRKKLGDLVFNDEVQKKRLENFIHPKIKKQIIKEAAIFEQQKKPYFIDIPLFFETKNYDIKKSLVIYVNADLQIQRLIKRDGCSEQEAIVKIGNQMDIEEKRTKATYVIDNTKDLKNLQKEVERVIKEIRDDS